MMYNENVNVANQGDLQDAQYRAILELETIEAISGQWKIKEAEREAKFMEQMNKLQKLEKKVKEKAGDLQSREGKLINLEEELKHKVQEVSRQLTLKEEEIINVKKRFRDEKLSMDNDKKKMSSNLEESKSMLDSLENQFRDYRREQDESPMAVL